MTLSPAQRRLVRLLLGAAVSGFFVAITISRVDLAEVGLAIRQANFGILLLAIPIVFVELLLRAIRWQRLLEPIAAVPLRMSVAYLSIGYFANSMLPARLGDLARAFLAGRAFGVTRLGVLGTIVVERVADGLFILGVVAVLGLVVAGGASLAETALLLAGVGIVGAAALGVVLLWIRSSGGGAIRLSLRSMIDKVLLGAASLRNPAIALVTLVVTAAAFAVAVGMFAIVASAAGLDLTLAQCALVMGGLALSTSIPAGPGSIGTYEFIGLTIMTSIGLQPETSLAVVVLVHLVATLPVALAGLVAVWQLHFRFSELGEDAEPANLAADARTSDPAAATDPRATTAASERA